jgi:hypothetical protein
MEEPKQGHPHTEIKSEHPRKPYWQRFHHDFKFWIALVLMLIAMAVYLGTVDLSHVPNSPPRQPVP